MAGHQIIRGADGNPAFAVIPWAEYERLYGEAGLTDAELYARAKAQGGEAFPAEVADRLLAGEHPIRVFREYRNMTQQTLAKAAGINSVYLSQIETGKRSGSAKTLAAIARVLKVDLELLIP